MCYLLYTTMLKDSPAVGRPESYPFHRTEILGWGCQCGATELAPAMTDKLEIIEHPIIVRSIWANNVKIVTLECLRCGRTGRTTSVHNVIEIGRDIERR